MLNKVDEESRVAAAINTIVSENHESNVAMGWWNDAKTGASLKEGPIAPYVFATKLALVHSELSEALEGIRKDTMDDHLPHRKSGEVELADAVIRIFDLAGALGYDLGGAYAEKRVYNSQRADHKKEARLAAGGKQY